MTSPLSPNNPLQRSGHDKVHAPDWCAGFGFSGSAPQVRRAAAERGRYAARARVCLAVTIFLLSAHSAYATPPLVEIPITRKNASTLGFTIIVNRLKTETFIKVLAPAKVESKCTPVHSGLQLRDAAGKMLFSQDAELGSSREGPVQTGTVYPPASALNMWFLYACASGKSLDSVRYIVKSQDWVGSEAQK